MKKLQFFCYLFLFLFLTQKSWAISLIRDSEIEDFLREITNPILQVSGLKEENIRIFVVNDPSLNAFVSGGQNIFINTGLITKYQNPDVLIGVIAHEVGHIAGGHLARGSEAFSQVGNLALAGYLAGIAAAAINPDAGMALLLGANQVATRTALKFTRSQEEAADNLALKYLAQNNISANGLVQLLSYFNEEDLAYDGKIDEYARTHPVSKNRINFIKNQAKKFKTNQDQKRQKKLQRIIVKLEAFLGDPDKIIKEYSGMKDNDIYARAIALHKKGESVKALKLLDGLIKKSVRDNYLWELKAQILFESGQINDAIIFYKKTLDLNPKNDLARVAMAGAIISLEKSDGDLIRFAIKNLEQVKDREKENAQIYQNLYKGYNKIGDKGRAYLFLSELNLLRGEFEKVKKYAKLAKENLDEDDVVSLLQVEDLKKAANDALEKEKEN